MRLRVGGADNANNNYLRSRLYYGNGGLSGTDGGATAGERWDFADTNTVLHPISVDVYSPFQSVQTSAGSKAVGYQGVGPSLYGIETVGITTVTTSYTGFSWFASNGTFTGKLLVYGYRQA
jgi:hypothetical protein